MSAVMTPVLYSFRRCPYAMRARLALHVAGIKYEHREVLLRDKPAAMLEASPKGTVPVFITGSGRVIDESLEIMHWALGRNDPEGWIRDNIKAARALIAENDGPFKFHLDRYKYKSRYDETAKRGDVDLKHRALAMAIIANYETALNASDGINGKTGFADMAIFPFIRQFAATQPDWWAVQTQAPNVRAWLSAHISSDQFTQIMAKHALWEA